MVTDIQDRDDNDVNPGMELWKYTEIDVFGIYKVEMAGPGD